MEHLAEYPKHKPKQRSKNPSRSSNPLVAGINDCLPEFRSRVFAADDFLPKRYTLYEPLLLLPINFTNINPIWQEEYQSLGKDQKQELFSCIAKAFTTAGHPVTHIAINAPIARLSTIADVGLSNVMRSPTGLYPAYGDWGSPLSSQATPTAEDFEKAFWVSTTQDHGIIQTWAPRWSMFSLGNLSEKKRVLGVTSQQQKDIFIGQSKDDIANMQVLDMYVGIGYFALCYLARGVKRVWGWDLNPWSIEGLRRGCEANGWKCIVLNVADDGTLTPSPEDIVTRLRDEERLAQHLRTRCVAFRGNNRQSVQAFKSIEEQWRQQSPTSSGLSLFFEHINLGLLPDSSASWIEALQLVADGGRLHTHLNVETPNVDEHATRVSELLTMGSKRLGRKLSASVTHVERVKSYGPGITHCVYDVQMTSQLS